MSVPITLRERRHLNAELGKEFKIIMNVQLLDAHR